MSDDDIQGVCLHCGVRIMRLFLPDRSASLWTHVPTEGPIYLQVECGLNATPAPDDVVPGGA